MSGSHDNLALMQYHTALPDCAQLGVTRQVRHEVSVDSEYRSDVQFARKHPEWVLDVYEILESSPGARLHLGGQEHLIQFGDLLVLKADQAGLFTAGPTGRLRLRSIQLEVTLPKTGWPHPDEWPIIRSSGEAALLPALFRFTGDRFHTPEPARSQFLREAMQLFLKVFVGDREYFRGGPKKVDDYPEKLREAVNIIEQHADQVDSPSLSVPKLAKEVGLSTQHLYGLFQRHVGMGPAECLRRLRLRRACEMLLSSKTAVKDIAIRAGYPDPYQFSRSFKKEVGVSPREYRNLKEQILPRHPFRIKTDNDHTYGFADVFPPDESGVPTPDEILARLNTYRAQNDEPFVLAAKGQRSDFEPINLNGKFNRYRNAKWESFFGDGLRLLHLPAGTHTFHGVPFRIPRESYERKRYGMLVMDSDSPHLKAYDRPSQVEIAIDSPCVSVYLLVAAGWTRAGRRMGTLALKPAGGEAASFVLRTLDPEKSQARKRNAGERIIQDFWPYYRQAETAEARRVTIINPKDPLYGIRFLYVVELPNPQPEASGCTVRIETRTNVSSTLGIFAATALKSSG